ncbi:MAG: ATP-binding cassette domain-containing protein [Kiritimatiellia bacterium]|nr:ATP-binding cassette domain-containing protein [Kiritimatiellia bacterium]
MLLETRHLCFRYSPVFQALTDVSVAVPQGGTLGIVGESGCGKSTFAKVVTGLLKPTSGEVWFEGVALARSRSARRHIQMVFQDAAGSLNPRMTIRQTLEEVQRVHGIASRTGELLDAVGLPSRVLEAYPRELSGGQCQRASIARCLALSPRLLIADEPVSALDVSVQARILNLLAELRERLGLAIVLISHDLAVVRTLCDRVAVIERGVIVEQGEPRELFAAPRHPYTRRLVDAVPVLPI